MVARWPGPSLPPTALTTTSAFPATAATDSAERTSPVTAVTASPEATNAPGSRTTARTWWPRSSASRTILLPMLPLAPKTAIVAMVVLL